MGMWGSVVAILGVSREYRSDFCRGVGWVGDTFSSTEMNARINPGCALFG